MSELPSTGSDAVPLREADEVSADPGGADGFILREPRAGDLTPAWRVFMIVTWIVVFFAYAAVWKASDEIGIGTWWLGSRSQPTPIPIRLIPFSIAFVVALSATYNARRLPWIGAFAALVLGILATFDFSWSAGLAVVQLGVASGALLTALGSFSGTYRLAPLDAGPGSEERPNG